MTKMPLPQVATSPISKNSTSPFRLINILQEQHAHLLAIMHDLTDETVDVELVLIRDKVESAGAKFVPFSLFSTLSSLKLLQLNEEHKLEDVAKLELK